MTNRPIDIRQRLDYFTKAMNILNSNPTSTHNTLTMKSQVQTSIDVAEIQGEVLEALLSIPANDPRATATLERVITDTKFKLLSLDEVCRLIRKGNDIKPFAPDHFTIRCIKYVSPHLDSILKH